MKLKRKLLRLAIAFFFLFPFLTFLCLNIGIDFFKNPNIYLFTPHDCINSRWSCQEYDIWFCVDKHQSAYGEAMVNGTRTFIRVGISGSGGTVIIPIAAENLDGIGNKKDGERTLLMGCSQFPTRRRIVCRVPAGGIFAFGDNLKENVLHFTREDLDEEICFWGEGCVKCGEDKH